MEKWIFVSNITSFEKLYILTKTVAESEITEHNHTVSLMAALNENGANRTEANSHPIKYVLFYNMVYKKDEKFVLTKYGEELIEKYDVFLENTQLRAKFFFKVLCSVKYPNPGAGTPDTYNIYPFRVIFKLLLDNRINKRLSISEFEQFLSYIHTENDYDKVIDLILENREGTQTDINIEKIAEVVTVISGWCNQFCVLKKEGDYIEISDNLDYSLPELSNEVKLNDIPYTDYFRRIVLKFYLFDSFSVQRIENDFYSSDERRGFLVTDVLEYYQIIGNHSNKGIYLEDNIEEIINFLTIQDDPRYQEIGLILSENSDENLPVFPFKETDEQEFLKGGYSMIYYGTPGCGKSYHVNQKYTKNEEIVIRTTFHPEYSNSDFVGQIIPKLDGRNVYYDFEEGPFTKALLKALSNPTKKVSLIIEEINRGNASAIFGDIFQLIDRDSVGRSEYEIDNYSITKYLCDKGCDIDKVFIPSNLWIIATMNTSDQNVFTLDTAFKRRWEMCRIPNKFTEDNKLANLKIPGSRYTWKEFVEKINDAIIDRNQSGLNGEDKQLGVYFVTKKELMEEDTSDLEYAEQLFTEKVLMYIWEDVAKIDPSLWFDDNCKCFDHLLSDFKTKHLGIFKGLFEEDLVGEVQGTDDAI